MEKFEEKLPRASYLLATKTYSPKNKPGLNQSVTSRPCILNVKTTLKTDYSLEFLDVTVCVKI